MSIANMLSHGLGAYLQTSNALEEREARKTARQREQERHEGWKAENAARMEDRAETKAEKARTKEERDARWGKLSAAQQAMNGVQQPTSFVAAEQPAAQPLPNGGIDQGKGVTTYPAGANQATEQTQVARQPDGQAQIVSPGNGIPVIEPGAPVKPVNMDAAFAARGVQRWEAPPAQHQGYDFNALQQDKRRLDALRIDFAKAGDAAGMAELNNQSQALLGKWADSFNGKPEEQPIAYALHLGKAKAVFGQPMTADQASQLHGLIKAAEKEGAIEAVVAAHRGDKAAMAKAYDKGDDRFEDYELVKEKPPFGPESNHIYGFRTVNGERKRFDIGNAFDIMTKLGSAESQVKMFIEQQKLKNDTRKTDADVIQSRAAAGASNASAAANRANAAQTNFETEYMKKHGIKPGGASGGGYKLEMNEVSQALGTPAVDEQGKPIADVMTGRQIVNRNMEAEQKFFTWMQANGLTDTNQALLMYKGSGAGTPAAGASGNWNGWTAKVK